IDFNRDIRPLLSNRCFKCHGPDPDTLEAGLRLDLPDVAVRVLESGQTAVVPGRPDDSELIRRVVTEDSDLRMPPAEHGAALSNAETALLRQWIEQGAPFARHWSYVKPQKSEVPEPPAEHSAWPRNPVDNFLLRQMLNHELQPSPEADRYALIRRVFLDVTGLPPTVEEADAFVAAATEDAYERTVNDLLQRPTFGEHWARKWLDLARYADSAGYADDPPRTIWAYRDWVIRAINDNMPFDQFTVEQFAGDLLPNPSESQLIATAFHRNTLTNNEGGTQDEEFRNVAIVDRVNTTMAVWMGTTIACAQCHNHKYDPIPQQEYFGLFAILNNTQDADRRDESPILEIFTAEQHRRQEELDEQIARLKTVLTTETPELAESQHRWEQSLQQPTNWNTVRPSAVSRSGKGEITVDDESIVSVTSASDTDTYTVELALPGSVEGESAAVAAVRIETLPHASLPSGGSGFGNGNFVITGVRAELQPPVSRLPQARFVRITNKGVKQILSLAEVEVFADGKNVAGEGRAMQHSTAFDGPPELAIDGNTNGDYQQKSVTHTDTVDNPW
ncbi:MAG: DUF1549 domain-containing protein, partial [Planctomycetaceae bacterium]|nr:DUF1549 domain-containing protein [Planctomycetaceae bacterium]